MGADLIGHFGLIPKKNRVRVFNEHLAKLTEILDEEGLSEHDQLALARLHDECWVNNREYLGENKTDYTKAIDGIMADLDDLMDSSDPFGPFRDMAETVITVNGVEVSVLFAGEMSWGDTPCGLGYQLLDKLEKLGFMTAFYRAIPWNSTDYKF